MCSTAPGYCYFSKGVPGPEGTGAARRAAQPAPGLVACPAHVGLRPVE